MAQITNKRLGELIQALFRILEKYPDGMKAGDALAALAATVTLTEYEAGSYESGRRFEKIVRFATVDTVRAGWLIKNDGIWTLIGEGAKALKLYKDPSEFHKKAAQIYQCWLKEHKKSKTGLDSPIAEESDREDESDKSVSVSYEEAKEQAQEKIDTFLHAMDAYDFQRLVAELLKAIGYHFFCTGGFTKDAEAYARSQESKRIMLVDSAKLVQLWTDNIPRLSDQAWQRLPLTPIYFLTPEG